MATPSIALLTVALRLGVGFDAEAAGGELPTSGRGPSEPSATITALPRLVLLHGPGLYSLALSYSPRLFYRHPDSALLERPILLHQLAFDSSTVAPTAEAGFSASAAHGESDFTATQAVFGEAQAISPEGALTSITRVEGGPSGTLRVNRRTVLRLSSPAGYQRISTGAQQPSRLWHMTIGPGLTHVLTPRDTIGVDSSATYTDARQVAFLQSRTMIGWTHVPAPRWSVALGGGVARVDSLRSEVSIPPSYYGLAQAGFTHAASFGTESGNLSLDARVDPLLGEVRPQGTASLSAMQRIGRTLSLSESISANAPTSPLPLPSDPNETLVATALSMAWRVGPATGLRWGVRAAWAGPHWRVGFEPRQRTLLGFVGLSLQYPSGVNE